MYDTKLIRNVLIKVAIDGNYSICDTCIHCGNEDKTCWYESKNQCGIGLEEYVPNSGVINS